MLYSAYNLQGDENSTAYLHEVVSVGELVSFVVLGGVDEGWMVLELELLGIASYLREQILHRELKLMMSHLLLCTEGP